ncbi:hypothetical protein NEDG_01520 [Nematocida displodere]|uniref:Pre-rRNA-processing protein IPI1 n=1 Tax=Nematocida displodere TaxID=1805483 RepID=A0A177EDD6_9MICR|nr:hypothetical protein NEDG_01520 [Nematocida displodere]
MFKRYKLRPKPQKPLSLRARSVGVSKRVDDEVLKITAMLKHSSSTVRMRGAREAEKLQNVSEEMVREIMKMSKSEKKDVRAVFYTVTDKLLSKALPAESKVWEEYIFLYMSVMFTCTVVDVRKDALSLLGLIIKYFPAKTNTIKEDLHKWLANDSKIVSLDPQMAHWNKNILQSMELLRTLKKSEPAKAFFTDTIYLLHTHVIVNDSSKRYFNE